MRNAKASCPSGNCRGARGCLSVIQPELEGGLHPAFQPSSTVSYSRPPSIAWARCSVLPLCSGLPLINRIFILELPFMLVGLTNRASAFIRSATADALPVCPTNATCGGYPTCRTCQGTGMMACGQTFDAFCNAATLSPDRSEFLQVLFQECHQLVGGLLHVFRLSGGGSWLWLCALFPGRRKGLWHPGALREAGRRE